MSPIKNRFWVLLKQKEMEEGKDISLVQVSKMTGVSRTTLQAWRDNQIDRFDKDVLEKLCHYFHCQPGDLIVLDEPPVSPTAPKRP